MQVLRTAKRSPARRSPERATTLLELMMVMTVMALMMGVLFPVMKGMNDKNKLRTTARELVALMKYARVEAVMGQRRTEVFLDTDKREYWLDLREPDPKTGQYKPTKENKKHQLEQKRSLPPQIWFDKVEAQETNIIKEKLVAVDFYPDGSASQLYFTLANERSQLTVEIIKSTAAAELTPGTIEDKKAKVQEEQANDPAYQQTGTSHDSSR